MRKYIATSFILGLLLVVAKTAQAAIPLSLLALFLKFGSFSLIAGADQMKPSQQAQSKGLMAPGAAIDWGRLERIQGNSILSLERAILEAYPQVPYATIDPLKDQLTALVDAYPPAEKEQAQKALIANLQIIAKERTRLNATSSINRMQLARTAGEGCLKDGTGVANEYIQLVSSALTPWPQDVSTEWLDACKRAHVNAQLEWITPKLLPHNGLTNF